MVASGFRFPAHPIRLYQRPGRSKDCESQLEVRRDRVWPRQLESTVAGRRNADMAKSNPVESHSVDAEHHTFRTNRRHSARARLAGSRESLQVRLRWRSIADFREHAR